MSDHPIFIPANLLEGMNDNQVKAFRYFLENGGNVQHKDIADHVGIKRRATIGDWKRKFNWVDKLKQFTNDRQVTPDHVPENAQNIRPNDRRDQIEGAYATIYADMRRAIMAIMRHYSTKQVSEKNSSFRAKAMKNMLDVLFKLEERELEQLGDQETQVLIYEQSVYLPGYDKPLNVDLSDPNNWHKLESLLTEQDPHNWHGTDKDK